MTDSTADYTLDFVGNAPYVVVALLVVMSLYSILTQKNLIKICVAISILASAANLFIVLLGYRHGAAIPTYYLMGAQESMVLPTPQHCILTAIVIALATTALMLSLIIMIYKHYGTLDIDEIRRLRG